MATPSDEPIHLPRIAENDYPAFLRLPGQDFPGAYDEWLNLTQNQAQHWGGDRVVVWVRINPDKFARFCDAKGTPCNKSTLYRLIIEIAEWQG